jgi:GT2 family glycosyltransferase
MDGGQRKMRVAVLMTCFNRKKMTLAALGSLFNQTKMEGLEMSVYLIDDGSKDGTSQSVAEHFPGVSILQADGSLFWNGGMRKAFAHALTKGFDGYIWFNDDTHLDEDALHRLLVCAKRMVASVGPAIVVGSVRDPYTGERSYGGVRRRGAWFRLDFVPQLPDRLDPIRCDTMNGNFIFTPALVARQLGNLDGVFRHQLGDFDYGLRAVKAGIPVVIAPGYFGYCSDNPTHRTWRDQSQPLTQRWRHVLSPKGAPLGEWPLYTKRHFGWRWPLYALSPYVKTLLLSAGR